MALQRRKAPALRRNGAVSPRRWAIPARKLAKPWSAAENRGGWGRNCKLPACPGGGIEARRRGRNRPGRCRGDEDSIPHPLRAGSSALCGVRSAECGCPVPKRNVPTNIHTRCGRRWTSRRECQRLCQNSFCPGLTRTPKGVRRRLWSALAERSGDGAFARTSPFLKPIRLARPKAVSRSAGHRTP